MKFLLESAGSGVCVSLSPDSISLASQCRCPKNRLLYVFLIYYPALGASLVAQMVKESACNAGDPGLIPGLGRSLGEGNGYPLQYSGLVTKSRKRQSDFHFHIKILLVHQKQKTILLLELLKFNVGYVQ